MSSSCVEPEAFSCMSTSPDGLIILIVAVFISVGKVIVMRPVTGFGYPVRDSSGDVVATVLKRDPLVTVAIVHC